MNIIRWHRDWKIVLCPNGDALVYKPFSVRPRWVAKSEKQAREWVDHLEEGS